MKAKSIPGYEGIYSIDTDRQIYSLLTGKILKQAKTVDGYLVVCLHKNKTQSTKKVHRLMAECFIDNPLNKPFVNHINGIKTDNKLENLEWCTAQENAIHAVKNGLTKNKPGHMAKMLAAGMPHVYQPIEAYSFKTREFLWKADSITQAAKDYNLNQFCIHRTLKGQQKKHRGLFFIRTPKPCL